MSPTATVSRRIAGILRVHTRTQWLLDPSARPVTSCLACYQSGRPSQRNISSSTVRSAWRPGQGTSERGSVQPEQRSQKWNEEISAPLIYVVDSLTNKLSEPQTRQDVLRQINKATHRLVQVQPDDPRNPDFIPVCKIVNKLEQVQAEQRRKKESKEGKRAAVIARSLKMLELNWAIDPHDLDRRIRTMKGFLSEGRKVEVILASKKRGRKASPGEREDVLYKIRQEALAVPGAKEPREMEGGVKTAATLFFQGRLPETLGQTKEDKEQPSAQ